MFVISSWVIRLLRLQSPRGSVVTNKTHCRIHRATNVAKAESVANDRHGLARRGYPSASIRRRVQLSHGNIACRVVRGAIEVVMAGGVLRGRRRL